MISVRDDVSSLKENDSERNSVNRVSQLAVVLEIFIKIRIFNNAFNKEIIQILEIFFFITVLSIIYDGPCVKYSSISVWPIQSY